MIGSTLAVVVMALAASAGSVATIIVPTGLDEDDAKRLHARVDAQVAAAGGVPLALSSSLEVKAECLDDASCARALLRAADAPWLLWVEALRAGPKLQIDARLLGADGRTVKAGGSVVDLAETLQGRPVVPADVLAPLSGGKRASKLAPRGDGVAVEPAPTGLAIPPPLAIAGVAVAAAGAGVSVVCLALIPGQLDVINDPASLGAEKESAALLVPTLAIFAVSGLVVGAGGGLMMFFAGE